jgi:hypothetical protein
MRWFNLAPWNHRLLRNSHYQNPIWPASTCWTKTFIVRSILKRVTASCARSYYYYYDPTALCWALVAFLVSWSCKQSVGLPERGIRRSQGLYLHIQQQNIINTHNTDIQALSGIHTHDPKVQASGDSSWLRPAGHIDRLARSYIVG